MNAMTENQDNTGTAYLATVTTAETECEARTGAWILRSEGQRFPLAIDLLGRTLEMMEKAAGCGWGCANPSHDLERLTARLYNLAMRALKLTSVGRSDE